MIWASPKRRLPITIAVIVVLVLAGTILAHTHRATADRGFTYSGTVIVQNRTGAVIAHLPISFAVSRSGTTVTTVKFADGLPSGCPSRTAHVQLTNGMNATIRSASRFTARLAIDSGRPGRTRIGTLVISGAFATLGRETGSLATSFSSAALAGCAATGGYSTKSV